MFPAQVVIPYWELQPARVGAYLDRLVESGARHFAAFVPWQLFESDISHSLHRFLGAVADRDLALTLIVTPELGLHYPHSGFPKELVNRSETGALTSGGDPVAVTLPPGSFTLPSLHHPETQKRYQSYVSRLSSFLADLSRARGTWSAKVTLVVGGSLWKSYRSPWAASTGSPFGAVCGDRSRAATLAFQQHLDRLLSAMEPDPELRAGVFEEAHRRAFDAESEISFRRKTLHALHRRDLTMEVREIELHVPEADPSQSLSVLARGYDGVPSVEALSKFIEEIASREAYGAEGPAPASAYFSSMGGFSRLSDKDRQFLVLESLLLLGARGGAVFLEAEDWLRATPAFRQKLDRFGKALREGGIARAPSAEYVVPHLWSKPDRGWDALRARAGFEASLVQYGEGLRHGSNASLRLVDRSLFLSRDKMIELLGWLEGAPEGQSRVLALPKTPFMTEGALAELKRFTTDSARMDMERGFPFRLYHRFGNRPDGAPMLVLFDPPDILSTTGELVQAWGAFIEAASVLAGVPLRDERPPGAPFAVRTEGSSGKMVFAFNAGTDARMLAGFALEVPARGIVPVPERVEAPLATVEADGVSTASVGLKEDRKDGASPRLESHGKGISPEVGAQ